MQLRYNKGAGPQITFTSDFHELVTGDLVPGPCVLRYDPLRLVELGDTEDEAHQIRAHVRFHPGGAEWQGKLELPAGVPLADLADPTGDGYMLSTTFELPEGCEELEIWFSCTHKDGSVHWDSDYGKNHWLRFNLADLKIGKAKIEAKTRDRQPQDTLVLEVAAKPAIDAISVRWRATSIPHFQRQVADLVAGEQGKAGRKWTTRGAGIPVPKGATVVFDLVYKSGERTYTDDNQGRWYVAD